MEMLNLKIIKATAKLTLTALLIIAAAVVLSGCGEINTQVENLMKITNDFVGERVVTLKLDGDMAVNKDKSDQLKTVIKEGCPDNLSYRTEVADGRYNCVFVLSFTSLEEYKTKVAGIIGRQISVAYGYTDTLLAKGTYYQEDYDGMELVKWLTDDLYQKGYKDINLDVQSTSNVVKYNNEVLSSKTSVMNTSTIKGEPVHSVTVSTVNHKNSVYDRSMVLSVPKSTYDKLGESLKTLMTSRTNSDGKGSWSENNGYMDYTVDYKNIDIERLQQYTQLFLDCRNENIYYGDQNQSSTPLAEQLVFEERINLLGFVSDTKDNVIMSYNYTLPEETTHGEGVELKNGEWQTCGEWANSTYKINNTNGNFDIRIPDGMQYNVKCINVALTSIGGNAFKRVVDFVYDRNTGEKGLDYAYGFLADKGFTVSKESISEGIVCRVTQQGTASDISNAVGDLFGSGNTFESTRHTNDMSVVTDLNVRDTINISHMLTGANSNIDMHYTVKSECGESIRKVTVDNKSSGKGAETNLNSDQSYTSTVNGGNFIFSYSATEANPPGVALYCVICGAIVIPALLIITLLFRHNQRLKYKEAMKQLAAVKNKGQRNQEDTDSSEAVDNNDSINDDFFNL